MVTDQERQQKKIQKFIDRMPALSTTVGKVLEVCSKTDASPNELNKVISLDPVLTGQVLKLINSAYYSLVNKVTSLPRAITMLGMNTVKNMALSTAIIATVGLGKKTKGISIHDFWAHSLGVGVAAKLFASLKDYDIMQREELFFAGLLHDLGKVAIGEEYQSVISAAAEQKRPLVELEREMLGITHQEVGAMIAEKWKLNPFLTSCICMHHDLDLDTIEDDRVAFVTLGDIYCNLQSRDQAGNQHPDLQRRDAMLAHIGLCWDDVLAKGEDVAGEIEKAKVFLQV